MDKSINGDHIVGLDTDKCVALTNNNWCDAICQTVLQSPHDHLNQLLALLGAFLSSVTTFLTCRSQCYPSLMSHKALVN